MVVKTELCAFSEHRIYPGHGVRFVNKTGQLVILASSKADSLFHQKKKPAKLGWTMAWRRAHKKLNLVSATKKKSRRVVKNVSTRGFSGLAATEFKALTKKAVTRTEPTDTKKHSLVAEAKEKAKKEAVERKKNKVAGKAPVAKTHAGKGR